VSAHICPTCEESFDCGRQCCDLDPNVPCSLCSEKARILIRQWSENIRLYGRPEGPMSDNHNEVQRATTGED